MMHYMHCTHTLSHITQWKILKAMVELNMCKQSSKQSKGIIS